MSRMPKMFARKRSSGKTYYYVAINRMQIPLGCDRERAEAGYHRLMLARKNGQNGPTWLATAAPTIAEIAAVFLDHVQLHRTSRTFQDHHNYLRNLVDWMPRGMRVEELRPYHVSLWLDSNPQWHTSGRRGAISSLQRCLNWAVEQELIERNLVSLYKKPGAKRRETVLDTGQKKLILEECSDELFKDYVTVLLDQGMRPEEIRHVEARHVDIEKGLLVFPSGEHKTGKKTGKQRVVYLTDVTLGIIRRLVEKHPAGPLFRNRNGKPWTKDAVHCRFWRMRRRLADKLPRDLSSYVFRRTYCTDALEAGLSGPVVAELMGHEDASMVSKVYNHIRVRRDHLRQAAEKVGGYPK